MARFVSRYKRGQTTMHCKFRLRISTTSSTKCHRSGPSGNHSTLMLEMVTRWWWSGCHKTQNSLCILLFVFYDKQGTFSYVPSAVTSALEQPRTAW